MKETSSYVSKSNGRLGVFAIGMFLMLFSSVLGTGWISLSAVAGTPKTDWTGEPGPEPMGGWGSGWINDTIFDPLGVDCWNPALATGPGNTLHAAVQCNVAVGAWNIFYSVSSDGGETWGGWDLVANSPDDETNPDISVHPTQGRIFVAYERLVAAGDHDVYVAYSDDGMTWTNVLVPTGAGNQINPSVLTEHDNTGAFYDTWVALEYQIDPDNVNVNVWRSTDQGASWILSLNQGGLDADVYSDPDLAYMQCADFFDRLYVVYRHGIDSTDITDIAYDVSEDDGATWLGYTLIRSGATDTVSWPTVASSRDGDKVMAAWTVNAADSFIQYSYDHDPTVPLAGWTAPVARGNTPTNGFPDLAPEIKTDGEGIYDDTIGGTFYLIWTRGNTQYDIVISTSTSTGGGFAGMTPITDLTTTPSGAYPVKGLTTRMGPDDGIWYPAVNFAVFPTPYEAMFTTPGMRSFVDTNPTGLNTNVDGTPLTAPAYFVWPAGYAHNLWAPSPQAAGPGNQYSWVSWSDAGAQGHAITAGTTDVNYTANYVMQHEYVFTTTPVNLDVEVDGVPTFTPASFWFDTGTTHDVFAPSPQVTIPGVRYVYNSWSDAGTQLHQITANAPTTLTANFDRQYWADIEAWDNTNGVPLNGVQVTVNAVPLGTTPTGDWFFESLVTDIGVEDPYFDGMNNFNFVDWSTGSGSNPLPYQPSMPTTLTANYNEAPSNYYSFSVSPNTQTIAPGGVATYTVTIDSINGYTGDVTLSASAAPGGLIPPANWNFAPNPATVPAGGQVTSTLTIDNTAGASDGIYTITVDGLDGGGLPWSNTTELIVATPTFDVTAVPLTRNIAPGMTTTYDVTVSSVNMYTGTVTLTASALPAGLLPPAQATFNPATVVVPAGGSVPSTLTIDNTAGVADDTYTITIQGDDTVDTDTFAVDLVVATVPMFSMDATPALRSINPGSMTTYTVTATSVNSYAGNVDVSVSHALTAAEASLSWDKTTLVVPSGGSDSAVLTVTTTAAIPLMDYTLTFYADDLVDNRTDQSTLNLTAIVDGSISGTVTDQDGDPLDDATVELYDDNDNLLDDTTTDSNGDYSFSGVGAGDYTVRAIKDGYYEDTVDVTVSAADPDQDNKDLELELITYEIEGTVIDKDTGDPIAGATVEVYDENGDLVDSDTTPQSGHFSIDDLLPGTYTVVIKADGYKTFEQDVIITDENVDLGDVDVSPKAEGNFLTDYWWLLLLIIIIVVVIIIVAMLAKRKKPEPEEVPPGTYAEAQVPPEQAPPYEAPPEQEPYQPPPDMPPEEPGPEYQPEAPPPE